MDAIVQLGCIVCRTQLEQLTPAEVHHLDGKTVPGAHLRTIPLCYHHHRSGVDNHTVTSRHPYRARFEARYGSEEGLWNETRSLVELMKEGEPIATV
jgi:hypothetical protein